MGTYTKDDSSATITFGTKFTSGPLNDEYIITRGFWKIDMSGSGYSRGSVLKATLIVYVASVTGGGVNARIRSDNGSGSNWGSTLDASEADFISTNTTLEQNSFAMTSTGNKFITLEPNNINFSGVTYYRFTCGDDEGTGATKNVSIASQNNGTTSRRPKIRFLLYDGQVVEYAIS